MIDNLVPNVEWVRDALYLLEVWIEVTFGSGKVVSQSIGPGKNSKGKVNFGNAIKRNTQYNEIR